MSKPDLPFAREDGDSVVVTWDRVDVLIPESYFSDPPLAEDLGGSVETLLFVDVRATEKEGGKPRSFAVRMPARLRLNYSESSEEADEEGDRVRVFTTHAGDVLIDSLNVIQSSDNVREIFRALAGARITGVAYEELADLFIEGSKINGAKLGVTRSVLEAVISEMARWKKDNSVPLRIPLAQGKASNDEFRFVKLKDLPRLNSVFTGIGFEDIQLAVQSGVRKTLTGEPQRESPMEEVMKY